MANKILHVEDSEDDVMLTAMAFRKGGVCIEIEVARDGDEAIGYFQKRDATLPNCVLLDLKLPTKSGLDVLRWIRQQPGVKRVPVVVLTSSLLPKDINDAYDLGANSYLVKPSNLETLASLAQTISHYWLRTNHSPVIE